VRLGAGEVALFLGEDADLAAVGLGEERGELG